MNRSLTPVKGLDYLTGIRLFKNNPLGAMGTFRSRYGYLPYFGGPLRTLFLFHPDDIRTVLVDGKNNNEKGDQAKLLQVALGQSLFIAEGEEWRRKKLVIQGVFHHQAIEGYGTTIREITQRYIQDWRRKGTFDLADEVMALVFSISGAIFFGQIPEERSAEVRRAFADSGGILARKFASPIKFPLWLPTPEHRRLKNAIAQLDEFTYFLIRRGREGGVEDESFLGRLLRSPANLSDREIRDEVVTFLGAGYETTSMFIVWTLYLLLRNPAYIDVFLQAPRGSAERKSVLQEGLRFYPSFPINVRQNISPMELGGKEVAPRTNFLISPYMVQRDPAFWGDPEVFRPGRFLEPSWGPRDRFLPFLIGPKKCIGEQLAYAEAEIVIEEILSTLPLELLTQEVLPVCDILLYPDRKLFVRPRP